AVRRRRVHGAELWVAGIDRAGIVIVDEHRAPRRAYAAPTDLHSIAHVAVAARRAIRYGRVHGAELRITGVDRAGIGIINEHRAPRRTHAVPTGLHSVARIAVVAVEDAAAHGALRPDGEQEKQQPGQRGGTAHGAAV